jgi:hypothetical protein
MFELHPNTGLSNQSFEIKYDSNGSPIYIWETKQDWLNQI